MNTSEIVHLCASISDLPEEALAVVAEVVAECWRSVEQAEESLPDTAYYAADIVRRFDTLEWT